MARKCRCRICGRWFRPQPQAGSRQRACSAPGCQRERHRRACVRWHRANPDYDREDRLRRRLRREGHPGAGDARGGPLDPLGALDWSAARDAVGLQVAVELNPASPDRGLPAVLTWPA